MTGVLNLGSDIFLSGIRQSGGEATQIDWRPPAHGDPDLVELLFRLTVDFCDETGQSSIALANQQALSRILAAQPVLRSVRPAHELLPGLTPDSVLHAGPAIHWKDMCSPMRGAIIGALNYEGLASSEAEAVALMDAGAIRYAPTSTHNLVAPMAGVVTWSMPLLDVENAAFGNHAYSPLNEGVGQVLRFGTHSPAVLQHLRWLRDALAPVLHRAVTRRGGVPLKMILGQALGMGDDLHQRNIAASLLFYRTLCRDLAEAAPDRATELAIMDFLAWKNEQFFLNVAMAASRAAMDPARNIPCCSLLTSMSRNGVDFAVNVSALGDEAFTAPSQKPSAVYFPGYDEHDANPDMGDSAIVECYGLGGMITAAALTTTPFFGAGTLHEALRLTKKMSQICVGANPDLPVPNLDFKGAPTGIDILRVMDTGILPVINSGVAHRLSGIGQVGTGQATPPMDVINKAVRAFYAHMRARWQISL